MPTTGYKIVPEVKGLPNLNEEPNPIDSTTLLEEEYETSEPGLKSNGVKSYTANLTDDLIEFWETLQDEYEAAAADGKAMYFCHRHPKLKKAGVYKGTPSPLNYNDSAVNAMQETTLYITPNGATKLVDSPTITDATSASTQGGLEK
jgi:hypothetical protein